MDYEHDIQITRQKMGNFMNEGKTDYPYENKKNENLVVYCIKIKSIEKNI